MRIIDFDDGRIDSLEAVKAHVEKDKLPYVVVHDYKAITTRKYGVKAYPVAYLIGADGKVIWNGHPDPTIVKELEAKVDAAIAEAKKTSQLARADETPPGELPDADRRQDEDDGSQETEREGAGRGDGDDDD